MRRPDRAKTVLDKIQHGESIRFNPGAASVSGLCEIFIQNCTCIPNQPPLLRFWGDPRQPIHQTSPRFIHSHSIIKPFPGSFPLKAAHF
jgi:hypothetical protein